jgi:hypothetical protein
VNRAVSEWHHKLFNNVTKLNTITIE